MRNGPLETIQSKGIKVTIYSSPAFGKPSFVLAYYAGGKRLRERASSFAEARAQAKTRIAELATGAAHVATFTPRQTAVIIDAVETLKSIGVSLSTVVREYVEAHKILAGDGSIIEAAAAYAREAARRKLPRMAFGDAVAEFLADLESKGLSRQHRQGCRWRLNRAAVAFRTNIKDISADGLEKWLSSVSKTPRTYNNNRTALIMLFNFAKRKGYLPRELENAAELVERRKDVGGEIQILTPENFAQLLDRSPETFLPYLALGGLAGLRSAEICRLDWREIDFAQGHILVSARKSKTASRRIVPICDALKAWLLPIGRTEGRVMPYADERSMLGRFRVIKAQTAGMPKIPSNALRHSYASYRLAQVEDAGKVSLEMGNSPQKLFTNYRQLVTRAQAERWFSVMPRQEGNVLAFSAPSSISSKAS